MGVINFMAADLLMNKTRVISVVGAQDGQLLHELRGGDSLDRRIRRRGVLLPQVGYQTVRVLLVERNNECTCMVLNYSSGKAHTNKIEMKNQSRPLINHFSNENNSNMFA